MPRNLSLKVPKSLFMHLISYTSIRISNIYKKQGNISHFMGKLENK